MLQEATEISLYMESLPSIVFDPPTAAAAAAVGVLRKSDQPGSKEGGS